MSLQRKGLGKIFARRCVLRTKVIAMSRTALPESNLQLIRHQLVDATQELNSLKMRRGESLRDFEYRVKCPNLVRIKRQYCS